MSKNIPQVVTVFKPSDNRWVVVEKKRTKIILCPAESLESLHCDCGFETEYPFKMLEHLHAQHNLSESSAIIVFSNREQDYSKEYLEIRKDEPIPKGLEIVEMEEETEQ